MSVIEILLAMGVLTFIIYASFNIYYLIELRRTSLAMRQLITRTDENLHPTLAALRHIFEDIGTITDNAAALSKSLRDAADAIGAAEKAIRTLYQSYEENFAEVARANVAGLKAGVKTGVVTLLKNLKDKKEG
jgi:ABC-type transporter Mla subunit MlaD